MDYYDTLIGEHAADLRCPYVHAYTEAETTCPTILDLLKMRQQAAATRATGGDEGET